MSWRALRRHAECSRLRPAGRVVPFPLHAPHPAPAPCALLEEALKGCAVFLSEALGPSLPRSVLRGRAPHSTVRSHTCRPRWPGPRLSERAVTHRGLARPPLSAPAAPLPRAPLRAGASFPHPHRLSTQLPDSAAPQPPTGRLRPAELAQAACRCSFSPGASKGAGARDVHVLSPSCCGRAQGFVGNDTFYYWFGAFSGHFKLAFLSESQYAGYKFQQGLMTRVDARKNRLEILKLHVP